MNPNVIRPSLKSSESLQYEMMQSRLRRIASPSQERDTRERQRIAEELLDKLRAHAKDPRVAALVDHLKSIVTVGAEALEKYDRRIEVLAAAEGRYKLAKAAHEAALNRRAVGTLDASEALELAKQEEIAHAAFRARDRELTEAQNTHLPNVGLPREADVARETTLELVKNALAHPIDTSPDIFRPIVDVAAYARNAGIKTDPPVAIWWIATEIEVLAKHKDAAENLKAVFASRWRHMQETQALSELARHRRREGIVAA